MAASDRLKQRVNASLRRLTGYELQRAKPASAPPAKQAAQPAKQAAQPAKQAAKPRALPKDIDDEAKAIIETVRPYTMTEHEKLYALISAVRYIVRHKIPGDIVECGVWRGGSMHAAARTLDMLGDHSRDLYLYDTFEGMTEPEDVDVRVDGETAAERLARFNRVGSAIWAYASLEDVQAGFEQVPYPTERVHFVKGPVEETVPGVLPDEIAILRLDTDWYSSTKHELEHMYERLVSGGVLLLDDYGWWQGARKATDEFLERTGERLLLIRMATGRVAVKP
jgi:hypothetical protein